jgi:hypothetical protein
VWCIKRGNGVGRAVIKVAVPFGVGMGILSGVVVVLYEIPVHLYKARGCIS